MPKNYDGIYPFSDLNPFKITKEVRKLKKDSPDDVFH